MPVLLLWLRPSKNNAVIGQNAMIIAVRSSRHVVAGRTPRAADGASRTESSSAEMGRSCLRQRWGLMRGAGPLRLSLHNVGAFADLLHDPIVRVALDDVLDVGALVFWEYREPARVLAQVRLVVDRQLDAFVAFRVAALAGEVRVGVELRAHLADLV